MILQIRQRLFSWAGTYCLRFDDPADKIPGLLLVLAIDAANSDNNK